MSVRKKIVAGNWKMNTNLSEAKALAQAIVDQNTTKEAVLILGTPFISLDAVGGIIANADNVYLAAQNCHQNDAGAYTGEVAVGMLQSVGCDYVILGHSERREYFAESDTLIKAKAEKALAAGMKVIFCCGEALAVRETEQQEQVVGDQIKNALFEMTAEQMKNIVIAYEPIWAIGTGVTASPEQAQDMHAFIRSLIRTQFGDEIAEQTSILYGGSVKPANADELFSKTDVDGGLVGGASLKADSFLAIAAAIG